MEKEAGLLAPFSGGKTEDLDPAWNSFEDLPEVPHRAFSGYLGLVLIRYDKTCRHGNDRREGRLLILTDP